MKILYSLALVISVSGCATSTTRDAPSESSLKKYDPELALTLGNLAEISYEVDLNKVSAQVDKYGFKLDEYVINDQETSTNGIILVNDEIVVLAFRGTQEYQDFIQDLKIGKYSKIGHTYCEGNSKIHGGLNGPMINITSDGKLYERLSTLISSGKKLYVTGHSLGGALSTVFAHYTKADGRDIDVEGVYTYGQPIVGNSNFQKCYNNDFFDKTFRHVNNVDIITKTKPSWSFLPWLDYRHVGTMIHYGYGGRSQYYTSWSLVDWSKSIFKADPLLNHKMKQYLDRLEANKGCEPVQLKDSAELDNKYAPCTKSA
jgi:triacylglycerol lipase